MSQIFKDFLDNWYNKRTDKISRSMCVCGHYNIVHDRLSCYIDDKEVYFGCTKCDCEDWVSRKDIG